MKKILLMVIVVGVLIAGTFSVAAEIYEDSSFENIDASEESFEEPCGNVIPCGGPGGGPGDVPG
jgi:hypothetical protein